MSIDIQVRTNKGDYSLTNSNMNEVKELLRLCRSKRQEVLELTILRDYKGNIHART